MTLRSLIVRGPFHGPTGYDHHVRAFVREFHRQQVAVQLLDFPGWSPSRLPPEKQDPWFETLGADVGARVALHFTMPHQVTPFPGVANVNYTMFEATKVHPNWIFHNSAHDLVIVPTRSSQDAWIDSGHDRSRIALCPLGIDPERFGVSAEPLPLATPSGRPLLAYRTRLLHIAELSPRKNQRALLRAWLRATSHDDDAILVLKVGGYADGWEQVWGQWIQQAEHAVGKHLDQAAPIIRHRAFLADDELPRLYATATHYISVSRGEGWDQPMMEAGASGLRLIAPDHSAYRAYLDHATARLLPSREIPADFEGGGPTGHLFVGANWWEPDEEATVAAIRDAIAGRDAPAGSARDRILREFTWERATGRLISLLERCEPATSWRERLSRAWRYVR